MTMFKLMFRSVLLLGAFFAAARGGERPEPPKPATRSVRTLEGWTVRVDDRLLQAPNEAVGTRALRFLEYKLSDIKAVVAADRLAKLQAVTIVLDLTHGRLRTMQYHPDAGWLKEHGYSADLVKCVHIPRAADLTIPRNINEQPWVVLHELAHSYHDQVLGFDEPRIRKAYELFKESGHGDSVLRISGRRAKHYALTDHKEFFAEMSEAYFGMNDFFPFNRAELLTAEPEIYELMRTIWGYAGRAGTATPPSYGDASVSFGKLAAETAGPGEYLSPVALVASQDGRTLYVAEATARQVAVFDTASGKVTKEIPLADPPAGLVLAPDGSRLYVAGASPEGKVHVIDTQGLNVIERIPVGHTPAALAISPDGKRLYVCNRFSNNVSILDLSAKKEVAKVAVTREPIAVAITPDGKWLAVANHLPFGPASGNYVAAVVSIVAADTGQVAATVQLLDGSTGLRGICVSPDGRFAYVTHILAHYQIPTTQLERGWMNTNAVSIIDLGTKKLVNTVLLDSVDLGAANPWGVACTADGKFLCVAHAGTHEVSVIGLAALHDRLAKVAAGQKVTGVSSSPTDVPSDLAFLVGLRARLKLQGKGPRGLAVIGNRIYAAEYFSDSLGVVDIQPGAQVEAKSIPLGPVRPMTPVRKGEVLFNDAALCFQTWQSCASCHPDARADALNWDLLNDGIGNPKNTKSMLPAHRTPPVMISGIRPSAEVAVRAGIRFIQFAIRPEEDAVAIDEYLKNLAPVSSPHLENGKLSAAAERGKQVFESAGCASCHPGDLGTDLAKHDVGIGPDQRGIKEFDTPTLVEVWRTAPYLFDGRAATMREVLTEFNPKDTHGATSKLSKQQIADLAEYVLSR